MSFDFLGELCIGTECNDDELGDYSESVVGEWLDCSNTRCREMKRVRLRGFHYPGCPILIKITDNFTEAVAFESIGNFFKSSNYIRDVAIGSSQHELSDLDLPRQGFICAIIAREFEPSSPLSVDMTGFHGNITKVAPGPYLTARIDSRTRQAIGWESETVREGRRIWAGDCFSLFRFGHAKSGSLSSPQALELQLPEVGSLVVVGLPCLEGHRAEALGDEELSPEPGWVFVSCRVAKVFRCEGSDGPIPFTPIEPPSIPPPHYRSTSKVHSQEATPLPVSVPLPGLQMTPSDPLILSRDATDGDSGTLAILELLVQLPDLTAPSAGRNVSPTSSTARARIRAGQTVSQFSVRLIRKPHDNQERARGSLDSVLGMAGDGGSGFGFADCEQQLVWCLGEDDPAPLAADDMGQGRSLPALDRRSQRFSYGDRASRGAPIAGTVAIPFHEVLVCVHPDFAHAGLEAPISGDSQANASLLGIQTPRQSLTQPAGPSLGVTGRFQQSHPNWPGTNPMAMLRLRSDLRIVAVEGLMLQMPFLLSLRHYHSLYRDSKIQPHHPITSPTRSESLTENSKINSNYPDFSSYVDQQRQRWNRILKAAWNRSRQAQIAVSNIKTSLESLAVRLESSSHSVLIDQNASVRSSPRSTRADTLQKHMANARSNTQSPLRTMSNIPPPPTASTRTAASAHSGPSELSMFLQRAAEYRGVCTFVQEAILSLIALVEVMHSPVTDQDTESKVEVGDQEEDNVDTPAQRRQSLEKGSTAEAVTAVIDTMTAFITKSVAVNLLPNIPVPPLVAERVWCQTVLTVMDLKNASYLLLAVMRNSTIPEGSADVFEEAICCLEQGLSASLQSVANSSTHIMNAYFMDDVVRQDWMNSKPFRRGFVVSYGVTAAVMHVRGCISDDMKMLPHHPIPVVRLALSRLQGLMLALHTTYGALKVTRGRIPQMKLDLNFAIWSVLITLRSLISKGWLPNPPEVISHGSWLSEYQYDCVHHYCREIYKDMTGVSNWISALGNPSPSSSQSNSLLPHSPNPPQSHTSGDSQNPQTLKDLWRGSCALSEFSWLETSDPSFDVEDLLGTEETVTAVTRAVCAMAEDLCSLIAVAFFVTSPASEVLFALDNTQTLAEPAQPSHTNNRPVRLHQRRITSAPAAPGHHRTTRVLWCVSERLDILMATLHPLHTWPPYINMRHTYQNHLHNANAQEVHRDDDGLTAGRNDLNILYNSISDLKFLSQGLRSESKQSVSGWDLTSLNVDKSFLSLIRIRLSWLLQIVGKRSELVGDVDEYPALLEDAQEDRRQLEDRIRYFETLVETDDSIFVIW